MVIQPLYEPLYEPLYGNYTVSYNSGYTGGYTVSCNFRTSEVLLEVDSEFFLQVCTASGDRKVNVSLKCKET